jgi:hypothetical protein
MKITIRPNLNTSDEITVHNGRLGKKLNSVKTITINCNDTVVRLSGNNEAYINNNKTVHAGLIGEIIDFISPSETDPRVIYNPHVGDEEFTVNGYSYNGGGIITMIGHKAYLVSKG